jgi:hypothetical protein
MGACWMCLGHPELPSPFIYHSSSPLHTSFSSLKQYATELGKLWERSQCRPILKYFAIITADWLHFCICVV